MGFGHRLARMLMGIMGKVYVWLDRRVAYTDEEVSTVLGLTIDNDLQKCSRYELCRRVEKEFGLKEVLEPPQHSENSFCRAER